MRTLLRWAARLYPVTWRKRYAAEFDALLDDISPSLADLFNVLRDVLRVRTSTSLNACLVLAPAPQMTLRLPLVARGFADCTCTGNNPHPVDGPGLCDSDAFVC